MIHPYSHYLERAARRWPEKVALIDRERSLTYAELDSRVSRLASGLRSLGLKPRDRVAIIQENNHRYVESVCAVARAGGVFVPMLGALTDADHAYIAGDCGATMLIGLSHEGAERARRLTGQGLGLDIIAPGRSDHDYEKLLAGSEPENGRLSASPDELAQILYTSGTTGKPKGVMHSFASTGAGIGAWVSGVGITHDDRLLGHFALSHFGGRVMDSSLCAGATLVIMARPDPAEILSAVTRHRITVLLMVPTLLQMLLDQPQIEQADLASLRLVLYAAAPASAALVERAMKTLGPVLATGFGQTEAYGLNTFLSAAEHRLALQEGGQRLSSIGRESSAWVQVQVLDSEAREVKPGDVGEICLSAPWVMKGYWGLPELTAAVLAGGVLHTGDLGKQDGEGYFYLADRKADMIITGGYNVYPREVEEVISAIAGVRECCVVGVPDPKWGEAVTAVVVADGVSPSEIITRCKSKLAAFKVPKRVEFAPSLPKSGVGKTLRRVVRETFWHGRERRVHGAE